MLLDVLRILISALAVLALALASDLWPWPQRSRSWLWGLVLWFRRWPHHFIKVHIQCIAAHRAINLFLSVQCSAWTEYKFRSVCLHVCVSITLSVNSPTGQTSQRSFTVDSLKDEDLRKDVPFGGLESRWWIIAFMGPKSPKTPILGTWIGISSQICEKFKQLYLQIYVSDWHEIWQAAAASNRDFVSGLV